MRDKQESEMIRKRERTRVEAGERALPVQRPLNAPLQLLILLTCRSNRQLGAPRPPITAN